MTEAQGYTLIGIGWMILASMHVSLFSMIAYITASINLVIALLVYFEKR